MPLDKFQKDTSKDSVQDIIALVFMKVVNPVLNAIPRRDQVYIIEAS
jgi:hypothetical protein